MEEHLEVTDVAVKVLEARRAWRQMGPRKHNNYTAFFSSSSVPPFFMEPAVGSL